MSGIGKEVQKERSLANIKMNVSVLCRWQAELRERENIIPPNNNSLQISHNEVKGG